MKSFTVLFLLVAMFVVNFEEVKATCCPAGGAFSCRGKCPCNMFCCNCGCDCQKKEVLPSEYFKMIDNDEVIFLKTNHILLNFNLNIFLN